MLASGPVASPPPARLTLPAFLPCPPKAGAVFLRRLCLLPLPTPNVHRAAEHGVKRRLLKWVRPDLFDALNDHKRAGRVVAILTGNLEPLVAPLARHLGCVCFSTGTECVTTDEGLAVYSGYLMGEPLLHTQKVRRALTDTGRYPDTCTLCVCVSLNHALYSRWPDATTIPATAPRCCFATLCPPLPHSL